MKLVKLYSNYNQLVPVTGGTLRWNLNFLPTKIGNLYPHVAGIAVRFVSGRLDNSSGGPTIAGRDLGALVSSVTLARNANEYQIDHVGLDGLIHREAVKAGGVTPQVFSSGSSAGVNLTFANTDFVSTLLEPLAVNDNDLLWPTSTFADAGFVELVFANPASLDSHLSYGVQATATIVVFAVLRPEPQIGADVRIGQWVDTLNTTASATRSGLMFPSGIYRRVILDSPSTGYPIPTASTYTAIESLNEVVRFPLGVGMTAADYNQEFAAQSAVPNITDATSVIGTAQVAALISPPAAAGKATESALYAASDVNFQLKVGSTAVSQHRFIFERVYARSAQTIRKVAAASGVSTTAQLATADGGKTSTPALMAVKVGVDGAK